MTQKLQRSFENSASPKEGSLKLVYKFRTLPFHTPAIQDPSIINKP
jgi:hypothetical protein